MKSKVECQSWEEWEDELSRYAGELVGDEEGMILSLPSKVLRMRESEGRRYVRDLVEQDQETG